jgi:hypothetical protein
MPVVLASADVVFSASGFTGTAVGFCEAVFSLTGVGGGGEKRQAVKVMIVKNIVINKSEIRFMDKSPV